MRAGEPQRCRGGGLGFEGEIRHHRGHRGLVDESGAERRTMANVPERLGGGLPHPGRRAEDAVEPRAGDHLDDRAYAAALLPHENAHRAVELDLAGGVGSVAELVFQTLDAEDVAFAAARSAAQNARHEKAAEPRVGLREHEKAVAHRRAAEPLVAGQPVRAVPLAGCHGPRGVGPHVGSALLLGHRHAEEGAPLARSAERAVVVARQEPRHPCLCEHTILRDDGDGRVRHRDRAGVAGFDLREEHEGGGASDVRPRFRVRPGGGVRARRHGCCDNPVIRGVVVDLVDAMPVRVEGPQLGLHAIRPLGVVLELGGADISPDLGERGQRPDRVIAFDALAHGDVAAELVDVDAGGRLVEHVVRGHVPSVVRPRRWRRGGAGTAVGAGAGTPRVRTTFSDDTPRPSGIRRCVIRKSRLNSTAA